MKRIGIILRKDMKIGASTSRCCSGKERITIRMDKALLDEEGILNEEEFYADKGNLK